MRVLYTLIIILILSVQIVVRAQSTIGASNPYVSKVLVQDSLEVSLYSPSMFRIRISHIRGEHFPGRYEIPFTIGKTTAWNSVKHSITEDNSAVNILTDRILIKIMKRGLSWSVWSTDGEVRIYPSDGPSFGMFKDGYTYFDNASALNEKNKNSRYSHWFYSPVTKRYTDIYLEEDLIEDMYFIYGPSYEAIYSQYNELVGPEPLLPKKGYGFFQTQHLGCEGTQQQLLDVALQFRDKNIPLDNLILDFEWGDGCNGMKEVTWGRNLNWSSNYTSPLTPEQMIKKLKDMHIDVMLIHHSAPDFANRKHQGWTETVYDEKEWNDAYKKKLDLGIAGTWQDTRINDVTDSYIWNLTESHQTGKRVLFLGCRKVVALNPWDFRYSVAPTENMIGARRYPFHWTEDASSSWNELRFQLKATNNSAGPLSGYSYLSSDGVAASWRTQARWNQFTALSAVARSHNPKPWSGNINVFDFNNKIRITGRDTVKQSSKPVVTQSETAEESVRKYLRLRYSLLPYIYSYAHVNYWTGMPFVRPMLLAFPNDYICSSDAWPYQYMLGNEILVAPVYGDFNTMEIYLPQGYDWIDYNTLEVYKNGGVITYNVSDINVLPIFVKSGSIIPKRQDSNWIDPSLADEITFEIFPSDSISSFTLFEDDGISTKYQEAAYCKTRIICDAKADHLKVTLGSMDGNYSGKPLERIYIVNVKRISKRPTRILVNKKGIVEGASNKQKEVRWKYDVESSQLIIQLKKKTNTSTEIVIE